MYDFNERYENLKKPAFRVKVYQCHKEVPYKFMDFEFAKQHGLNSIEDVVRDYDVVADFKMKYDDGDCLETNMLNDIYYDGNNGVLQQHFKMHSISMSDIIEINGKKHYVNTFGFIEM